MAVCGQASFSQRATWPPSAAVRQRSIALITFSWSRLTCPRLASRQAGPWSRKISATSRVGRPTSAALTPPVRAYASSSAAGACRQAARADSRWRRSDLWPHVCSAPSCPAWNAQAEPGSAGYRCRPRADAWQSCGAYADIGISGIIPSTRLFRVIDRSSPDTSVVSALALRLPVAPSA